jgi:hypothetical protein
MNKNTRENTACFDELETERPQDIKMVQFTKRTNNPQLAWLQYQLDSAGIINALSGESFHAPILTVDESRLNDAWDILTPVDNIPDDDPMFSDFDYHEFNTSTEYEGDDSEDYFA